jgi:hypothetical protein
MPDFIEIYSVFSRIKHVDRQDDGYNFLIICSIYAKGM